jgi:hypothetical protein
MIKSIIELQHWLRSHNLDPSTVKVTFEFEGPDAAARASRHLQDDSGRWPSCAVSERCERIAGIDVKIVGRA